MNGTQRRETFIALRARREGYQIASEINNPPMEVPLELRPPLRVERIDPFEGEIMYQPDYRAAHDPAAPIPYEPNIDPHVPRWLWLVLGLQILAILFAAALVLRRFF